jgi:ribonuclease Z
MPVSIHFLGVGDATCTEGPNTSLLYVGDQKLLVDCGPTVPKSAFCVLGDPDALDAIWITHQHADHCFGLPTLLLRLRLSRRRKPLELLGGPGAMQFVRAVVELGYPGSFGPEKCFPIRFTEVDPESPIERSGLRLATARTQHRVTCHAMCIDDGTHRVCVSGDGKPTAATLRLYRDASLVIHECEWDTRVSEDHSNVAELRPLLGEANVKRLAIVHCNDGERERIRERVASELGERAWLPNAGEVVTLA